MDFRTIFEQIPEEFDKWRPRYCDELSKDLWGWANWQRKQHPWDRNVLRVFLFTRS